jgi:TPP-dependent indolepyruvate ferredoxin oxidoreductase alpha subunit
MGQIVREIARAANGKCKVIPVNRVDGHLLTPQQIADAANTSTPKARCTPYERGTIVKFLRQSQLPHVWCPGCGDGMVVKALLQAIGELQVRPEQGRVVSGIGCSGRTPFVLDFNTMHTTHGRALAFATGIKLANPELHVIVIMGDGDASAIGGNHFIHACRRNLDLTALVFNNGIYGLTGGQLAPTTPQGKRSTTSQAGKHRAGLRPRPPRPGRRRRLRRSNHLLRPQAPMQSSSSAPSSTRASHSSTSSPPARPTSAA